MHCCMNFAARKTSHHVIMISILLVFTAPVRSVDIVTVLFFSKLWTETNEARTDKSHFSGHLCLHVNSKTQMLVMMFAYRCVNNLALKGHCHHW